MAKTSASRITGERSDFGPDLSLFSSLAVLSNPAVSGLSIGEIGEGFDGSAASVPVNFGYSDSLATPSSAPPLSSSAPSDDGSAISGLNAFAAIDAPLSFSVDARIETDTDHDLWAGTWNGSSQVTGNGAVFAPLPEYQHAPGHDHGGHDHGDNDHDEHGHCGHEDCGPDGCNHDHDDEDQGTDPGAFAADGGSTPSPESGSPTSGTSVSSYSYSGENHIDSLLGLYKWGGALGTGANLTYSFGTANSIYASGYSEPTNGFAEFSSHQKAQTRLALEFWSDVADLTFTEVTDSASVAGDLRYRRRCLGRTCIEL